MSTIPRGHGPEALDRLAGRIWDRVSAPLPGPVRAGAEALGLAWYLSIVVSGSLMRSAVETIGEFLQGV